MKNIISGFTIFNKIRMLFILILFAFPFIAVSGNSIFFQIEINNQLNEKITSIQLIQNEVTIESLISENEYMAAKTRMYFFVKCEIYDIKVTTESGKEIVLSEINLCEQNKQLNITQKSNL